MMTRFTRVGLGIGAALIAVGMAAGVMAATQNTNDPQPPFRGGRMGGPMGPGGPGMGPLGMLGPIQRLGLTDTQKDQVKGILDSHRDEFKALGDRAREAHQALETAMTADELNDAAIRQASAAVAAIDADMAVAGAHAGAEVMQILTADQRAQLKKLRAERPDRGQGGPGGPGRGGRGGFGQH